MAQLQTKHIASDSDAVFTKPFWEKRSVVSPAWRNYIVKTLIDSCSKAYADVHTYSPVNVPLYEVFKGLFCVKTQAQNILGSSDILNTHIANGFLLSFLAGSDLWRIAQRRPDEIADSFNLGSESGLFSSIVKDMLFRPRLEYIILTLAAFSCVIWLLALGTFNRKIRSCWAKAFCKLCCVDRNRIPWSLYTLLIYCAILVVFSVVLPILCIALISTYIWNVDVGFKQSLCHGHRTAYTLTFGVDDACSQFNHYNIVSHASWKGIETFSLKIDTWQQQVLYDYVEQIKALINESFNVVEDDVNHSKESFHYVFDSFSATEQALDAYNDTHHLCVLCEASKTQYFRDLFDETQTSLISVRNRLHDYKEDSVEYVDRMHITTSKMLHNLISKVDDHIHDYGKLFHQYSYYLLKAEEVRPTLTVALWCFSLTFIILGSILAAGSLFTITATLKAAIKNELMVLYASQLKRRMGFLWVSNGFALIILLLCSTFVALVVEITAQPCVFGINELLKNDQYTAYPGIVDFIKRRIIPIQTGSEDTTIKQITHEFLTFQGDGDLKNIHYIREKYDEFLASLNTIRKKTQDDLNYARHQLNTAFDAKKLNQMFLLIPAMIIDIPAYAHEFANGDYEDTQELILPRSVLLSGVQQHAMQLEDIWDIVPRDIVDTSWLNDVFADSSHLNILYGMDDIQDAINAILSNSTLHIPKYLQNWCLQYYNPCLESDLVSYGCILSGEITPEQQTKIRAVEDAIDQNNDILSIKELSLLKKEFRNSVVWATRKLKLLKEKPFIIVNQTGSFGLSFEAYSGTNSSKLNGEFRRLVEKSFTNLIDNLSNLLDLTLLRFNTIISSMKSDIDSIIMEIASEKTLLIDFMISADSICLGIIERSALIFIFMLCLAATWMLSTIFFYKGWHFIINVQQQLELAQQQHQRITGDFSCVFNSKADGVSMKRRDCIVKTDWDSLNPATPNTNYYRKLSKII